MNVSKALRLAAVALIVAATFAGTTQIASAATSDRLTADLGALWTIVLQTPSNQNPFGGGGGTANACWKLGGNVVAPFGPLGVTSCTVKPGTRIVVVGSSGECSTPFEEPPGTDLEACARGLTSEVESVTVDGRQVSLSDELTSVLPVTLPANNLFSVDAGSRGQFVAYGWVTLLTPLTPGNHTIVGPT